MPEPMELAYEERGDGPVLLFIHGFPLDRTMWIPQLAGLARVRRSIALDLRGHGLSQIAKPEGFSMDLFADDVARTLDDLKVDTADVCALSMGGYVALALWRRHRERIRSLILCDTRADADSDQAKAGRDKAAELVLSEGMDALYEQLEAKMLAPGASEDLKGALRRIFNAVPPAVAAADLRAMRDRPDATDVLGSIDVPVLWVHGEEDAIMPIDAARATAERIPGARFVGIPKAGHMAPMEKPEQVNEAISAFLA